MVVQANDRGPCKKSFKTRWGALQDVVYGEKNPLGGKSNQKDSKGLGGRAWTVGLTQRSLQRGGVGDSGAKTYQGTDKNLKFSLKPGGGGMRTGRELV